MSSFDEEERRSKIAVIPKSSNDGKMVKLAPRQLETKNCSRTVLPEEQYLQNLEQIIVKDYFPELPKLKAQAEYMDAKDRNDIAKMRELQIKFKTQTTDRRTSPSTVRNTSPRRGNESPDEFDPSMPGPSKKREHSPLQYANAEGDNESVIQKKKKKLIDKLSVDKYLNKFTSEDNASFEELSALAERREKAKNAWLYEATELHNKEKVVRHAIAASADVQLALRYSEEDRPVALDNWTYKARNSVIFNPDGAPLTDQEKAELAAKNQLEINKAGTRFPQELRNTTGVVMARAAMYQAANNAGKVDILGHEAGMNTKTLGVLATPSPAPGVEDSPFMTWGSIDGTPFRLDAADTVGALEGAPTFKIPEVPYREQIAQGIHETIAVRYREKRKAALQNAERAHFTPNFSTASSSEKVAMLSPAARRLVTNKLGIKLAEKGFASPSSTPLMRTSSRTPGTGSSGFSSKTPISSMIKKVPRTPATPGTPSLSSLTDDLMPARPLVQKTEKKQGRAHAGDFF